MTKCADSCSPELPWFALRVKPRHEKSVAQLMEAAGYEPFLPLSRERRRWSQRWKEIEMPLFPGYLFARFERNGWGRVMNIPGVIDAVRIGKLLAVVDEKEVNSLRLAQNAGCAMESISYFPAGQNIEIQDGPLAGVHGHVIEDNGEHQVVLSITLLQRSVRLRVERDDILAVTLPVIPVVAPHAAL